MKCLGHVCKCFRRSIDKRLSDVAREVGTTFQNVSAFERGRNNNANIFVWYVRHGLNNGFELFQQYVDLWGDNNGEDI